jgi:serpin B
MAALGFRRRGILLFALVALLALGAVAGNFACGVEGTEPEGFGLGGGGRPENVEVVRSQRELAATDVESALLAEAVAGNTRFALDLFQAIRSPDQNLVFSPHSLSAALTMTLAGARGEAEREMLHGLRQTLAAADLHSASNGLGRALAESAEKSQRGDLELELRRANSLWGEEGLKYLPSFLDLLAEYHGAGLQLVDDLSSEEARLAINDWVSRETEGHIAEALPPGTPSQGPANYMVLANALSLSAPWELPFPPESTAPRPFHLLDGTVTATPTMSQTIDFAYRAGLDYQAMELPYVGREFAMVILLPGAGRFEDFAQSLTGESLAEILGGLERGRLVLLALPKFEVEWRAPLKEPLQELGMRLPFQPGSADFSGVDGTGGLWIEEVYQATRVAVDEQGTEASAGSLVRVAAGLGDDESMTVDRAFLFLIRHVATGEILFVGQVVDPRG